MVDLAEELLRNIYLYNEIAILVSRIPPIFLISLITSTNAPKSMLFISVCEVNHMK